MLRELLSKNDYGSRGLKPALAAIGCKILRAELAEPTHSLILYMDSGVEYHFFDSAQACCEARYMTCDDDLETFAGATVVDISVDYSEEEGEYGESLECAFLRIHTDAGVIVACNHNEHNGYYGGFDVTCRVVK
jgi:hypothetical protein